MSQLIIRLICPPWLLSEYNQCWELESQVEKHTSCESKTYQYLKSCIVLSSHKLSHIFKNHKSITKSIQQQWQVNLPFISIYLESLLGRWTQKSRQITLHDMCCSLMGRIFFPDETCSGIQQTTWFLKGDFMWLNTVTRVFPTQNRAVL